jgi:hypothetical protein
MDCGLRIADCGFETDDKLIAVVNRRGFINPQSAIRNPQAPRRGTA